MTSFIESKAREVNPHSSVLAIWLRPLVSFLKAGGFDSAALFASTGININTIFSPNARIPVKQASQLWHQAAVLTKHPFIGIEVFRETHALQAGTLSVAMMSSRNFYEALQCMVRLSHLISDSINITVERESDLLYFNFYVYLEYEEIISDEAMDTSFLIVVNMLRQGLVSEDAIKLLCFKRDHPGEEVKIDLETLLGIPTRFDSAHYSIIIDWHKAQTPNPYWIPELAQMSESLALKELEQLSEANIVSRVRQLIQEQLATHTPQRDDIAKALNISTRQLQRKLSSQGTVFSELLQQVRITLAYQYLRDPNLTMVEISFLLGFQDQSNFVKAFKQWCGETPGQYRKRILV